MKVKMIMYISNHGANIEYFSKKFDIISDKILDFSSNVNIFSPNVDFDIIFKHIKSNINKYPDINYTKLKESISSIYKIDFLDIYLGNGATEVLYDLLNLDIFKIIGIFNPTFSEYERACNSFNKNVLDLDINLLDFIDKIESDDMKNYIFKDYDLPDILIICNPNNPTGKIYKLKKLLDFCKDNNIFLLVDETFIDFCYNDNYSLKEYVSKYDNLIILNAITKFFAMTGARLGYCFSSNYDIIKKLNLTKKPWNINILAESIVYELAKLDNRFYDNTRNYYSSEVKRLFNKYSSLNNIEITNSNTCFFCITFYNVLVEQLQSYLIKNRNILVRVLDNYKNINSNSIRIAIKDKENNNKIFSYIKEFMEDNLNY